MSDLPLDKARCAASNCSARAQCRRFVERDERHKALWWTDYSTLGMFVHCLDQCENAIPLVAEVDQLRTTSEGV